MQETLENIYDDNIASWSTGVSFKRTNPLPLDKSSLFKSYEDAVKYANGEGDERGLGKTAYVGQIIAVYNNTEVIAQHNDEATTYEDLKIYVIGLNRQLKSLDKGSIVNVKDFGATGIGGLLTDENGQTINTPADAINDDTESIQRAADIACELEGTLYFPQGIYNITKPIYFHAKTGLVIKGEGFNTVIQNPQPAIYAINGENYPDTFTGDYLFKIQMIETPQRGLQVSNLNFKIHQLGLSGIYCREIGMSAVFSDLWITDSTQFDSSVYNIWMSNGRVPTPTFGIHINSLTSGTIERVKIGGFQHGAGLCIEQAYSTKIINNDITFCKYGIYLLAGNNLIIKENRIDENDYGVYNNVSSYVNPHTKIFSDLPIYTNRTIVFQTKGDDKYAYENYEEKKLKANYYDPDQLIALDEKDILNIIPHFNPLAFDQFYDQRSKALYVYQNKKSGNMEKKYWEKSNNVDLDNIPNPIPFVKSLKDLLKDSLEDSLKESLELNGAVWQKNSHCQPTWYRLQPSPVRRLYDETAGNHVKLTGTLSEANEKNVEAGKIAYWQQQDGNYHWLIKVNNTDTKQQFKNIQAISTYHFLDCSDNLLPETINNKSQISGVSLYSGSQNLYAYGQLWHYDSNFNTQVTDTGNVYCKWVWDRWVPLDQFYPIGLAGGLNAVTISDNRFEASTYQAIELVGYGGGQNRNNNIIIENNYFSSLGINFLGDLQMVGIADTNLVQRNITLTKETGTSNSYIKKIDDTIDNTQPDNILYLGKTTDNNNYFLIYCYKNQNDDIRYLLIPQESLYNNGIYSFLDNYQIELYTFKMFYPYSSREQTKRKGKFCISKTFQANLNNQTITFGNCNDPMQQYKAPPIEIKTQGNEYLAFYKTETTNWLNISEEYLLKNLKTFSQAISVNDIYGLTIIKNNFKGLSHSSDTSDRSYPNYLNTTDKQNLSAYESNHVGNLTLRDNTPIYWKNNYLDVDNITETINEDNTVTALPSNTRLDNWLCKSLGLIGTISQTQQVRFHDRYNAGLDKRQADCVISNNISSFPWDPDYINSSIIETYRNAGQSNALTDRNFFYLKSGNPKDNYYTANNEIYKAQFHYFQPATSLEETKMLTLIAAEPVIIKDARTYLNNVPQQKTCINKLLPLSNIILPNFPEVDVWYELFCNEFWKTPNITIKNSREFCVSDETLIGKIYELYENYWSQLYDSNNTGLFGVLQGSTEKTIIGTNNAAYKIIEANAFEDDKFNWLKNDSFYGSMLCIDKDDGETIYYNYQNTRNFPIQRINTTEELNISALFLPNAVYPNISLTDSQDYEMNPGDVLNLVIGVSVQYPYNWLKHLDQTNYAKFPVSDRPHYFEASRSTKNIRDENYKKERITQ